MDKKEVIEQIIDLQQRFSRAVIPYAIESWRELDVPLAQLKSLLILAGKDETNLRTLAQDLKVTPGDVTGIIERLVSQGLVVRYPNPKDRRVTWLQPTEKGQELVAMLMESHARHMVGIMEYMSLDELVALSKGLTGIVRAVEEHQKEFGLVV
ncbi:MAG: MarR family transcriptional regulator [Dehalococcoidales bacterium]|jgi:DNA-binding MarR family transcriptional regulator